MSNIEHRRVPIAASAVTIDPNWPDLQTAPTVIGEDLAAGEIRELNPRHYAVSSYYVVMDGMGDGAAPITNQGAASVDLELVTRHVNRGIPVVEKGSAKTGALATRRQFEGEVPSQGQSTVRVTSVGAGLPVTGALWFYASEVVQ